MKKSLLLFAGLFFTYFSYGQTAEKPTFWLGAGLGKTQYISGMVAAGFEPRNTNRVLTARYSVAGELLPDYAPGIKMSEVSLLYGVRLWDLRLSAGLGTVWGVERGRYLASDPDPLVGTGQFYERKTYSTVGIPAEVRYITSLTNWFNVGVTAFGNLNGKRSFAGVNFSLYVGQFSGVKK